MKVNEIRNLSTAELTEKVAGLKEELFNLRFQLATGQLENPMRIREVKKTIARIKTVQREEELKAAKKGITVYPKEDLNVAEERKLRKVRQGIVVSDKMDKTVVVAVERKVPHKLYKKSINTTTKFKAHDENNECRVGDTVRIVETRPLSHDKRWRVEKIVARQN